MVPLSLIRLGYRPIAGACAALAVGALAPNFTNFALAEAANPFDPKNPALETTLPVIGAIHGPETPLRPQASPTPTLQTTPTVAVPQPPKEPTPTTSSTTEIGFFARLWDNLFGTKSDAAKPTAEDSAPTVVAARPEAPQKKITDDGALALTIRPLSAIQPIASSETRSDSSTKATEPPASIEAWTNPHAQIAHEGGDFLARLFAGVGELFKTSAEPERTAFAQAATVASIDSPTPPRENVNSPIAVEAPRSMAEPMPAPSPPPVDVSGGFFTRLFAALLGTDDETKTSEQKGPSPPATAVAPTVIDAGPETTHPGFIGSLFGDIAGPLDPPNLAQQPRPDSDAPVAEPAQLATPQEPEPPKAEIAATEPQIRRETPPPPDSATSASPDAEEPSVVDRLFAGIKRFFAGLESGQSSGPSVTIAMPEAPAQKASAADPPFVASANSRALPPPAAKEVASLVKTAAAVIPPPAPATKKAPLTDVVLSLGSSGTLDRVLERDRLPAGSCIERPSRRATFCLEPIEWPAEIAPVFAVNASLYRGAMAVVRYDDERAVHYHAIFPTESFARVVAHLEDRYGPATDNDTRLMAIVGKPRQPNPSVRWMSVAGKTKEVTVIEVRTFDDVRNFLPDTSFGVIRLFRVGAHPVFDIVSTSDFILVRMRQTNIGDPSASVKTGPARR